MADVFPAGVTPEQLDDRMALAISMISVGKSAGSAAVKVSRGRPAMARDNSARVGVTSTTVAEYVRPLVARFCCGPADSTLRDTGS